uniref:(northern house mosquito) hypothetical protein n=1 Tax=Culex pipiens TaxID=7175 RepID=A0A8D8CBI1_CULPI
MVTFLEIELDITSGDPKLFRRRCGVGQKLTLLKSRAQYRLRISNLFRICSRFLNNIEEGRIKRSFPNQRIPTSTCFCLGVSANIVQMLSISYHAEDCDLSYGEGPVKKKKIQGYILVRLALIVGCWMTISYQKLI